MNKTFLAARKSGNLALVDRNLSKLPNELWRWDTIVGDDGNWWEVKTFTDRPVANNMTFHQRQMLPLSRLDVSHNSLIEIPEEVIMLTFDRKCRCLKQLLSRFRD